MKAIDREILSLAIPAIISNITTPLLSLADTAITGRMGAAAYIGAIAVGGSMFSLAYWLLNFLRMGTSGLTAQAYGAGSGPQACALVLWRGLAVAAVASALLIALSPAIAAGLLAFLSADAETSALARQYFMIVVLGAPAVLGNYALSGWFLGMQDSRAPMWMALATNLSNIALSATLVFACGMGMAGVAGGTLAAQWLGLGVGAAMAQGKFRLFSQGLPPLGQVLRGSELRRFFSVNFYIFLRTMCLVAVTLWFTRSGASHGADVLAANALLMQLFLLFSYFMDGFAFAGEAMAGKYLGMRSQARLSATVRALARWAAGIALAFTLIYALAGKQVLALLTDDPRVVAVAMAYMPWAIAVPAAGAASFMWDGIFIGMSMVKQMFATMLCATAAYFILYALFSPTLGNHGLWLAFIAYLTLRGALQTLIWLRRRPQGA